MGRLGLVDAVFGEIERPKTGRDLGGEAVIYPEGFEEAQEYARSALQRMEDDRIPPTPEAFAVLYLYYSGKAPDLSKTLGILETNGQTLTAGQCAELHAKYLGVDVETRTIQETSERVQAVLSKVSGMLEEGSAGAEKYSENLQGFAGALGGGGSLTELREMVLSIATETKAMMDHTKRLDGMFSNTSSEMQELRRNLENIRRETLTDALTGIRNRKHFDEFLKASATDAMETGHPMSIMMTDIDHFKKFNDTWGHQTGDEVLRLVAKVLDMTAKEPATACRYGGEEFSIILPGTGLRDAMSVAEHVRLSVQKKKIIRRQSNENLGNITLSIGVAEFEPGESLTDFVHRADSALYKAKRAGRNQVIAADGEETIGME